MQTVEHSFQARRLKLSLQYYTDTKPWRIYVSNQTEIFWAVVILPFWNPHWCLVKIYNIIQMKAFWCESCGIERNNNVLTIHPKSMAGLVEASASVRWLLWRPGLVDQYHTTQHALKTISVGPTPIVNRYCLKHVVFMLNVVSHINAFVTIHKREIHVTILLCVIWKICFCPTSFQLHMFLHIDYTSRLLYYKNGTSYVMLIQTTLPLMNKLQICLRKHRSWPNSYPKSI